MSRVMLVSPSRDLARRVRTAVGDDLTVLAPEQLPAGPAQLLALATDPDAVRVVLVDVGEDDVVTDRCLDLATRLDQAFPQVGVLLATTRGEELALRAMRAGVRDVLSPDLGVEDLRWVLRRTEEASATRTPGPRVDDVFTGRVITVASPKGGVGKTTIATNLAVGLAGQSPQGTVLLDLDLQFGDVGAALDLEPASTLGDLVTGAAARDVIAMKSLLSRHGSGLHVIPGVASPVEADRITTAQVSALVELLKREFRYVVIDTAPGLGEQTLAALDHTTDLVLVTGLDVPGVRGLRKELALLDELDLHPATRHVVVNMADTSGGLSVADVEATIGRGVDLVVPRSRKVVRSTNEGRPIVLGQPRDAVSKGLQTLISRLAPVTDGGGPSGRHRGRLGR